MTQTELDEIIEKHQKWLNNKPNGIRAEFVDLKLSHLTFNPVPII